MTSADAIEAIVEAEAVLYRDKTGKLRTDRPTTAEVIDALTATPEIADEFIRVEIFPSWQSLARYVEIRGQIAAEEVTRRFNEWVITDAIDAGAIERQGGRFISKGYDPKTRVGRYATVTIIDDAEAAGSSGETATRCEAIAERREPQTPQEEATSGASFASYIRAAAQKASRTRSQSQSRQTVRA